MPYLKGTRLPGERASKLGHLEVIRSPLVQKLCKNFEDPECLPEISNPVWQNLPEAGEELKIIFSSDGSFQTIEAKQLDFPRFSGH